MMIPAENLRDWEGRLVLDAAGARTGSLEAVYVDTASDQPAFVTVQVGALGRRRLVFVPLVGATVTPDHLTVGVEKKLARGAPSIDTDGELVAEDEPAVFAHYDMDYQFGSDGGRRLARR